MKNALRFLCLALAVMLVSGAFSCPAVRAEAAEAAAAEITAETTLATFDGEEIHYHEVYDTAYGLMESDDDSVAANFDRALERLIQSRVADAKIAELGLDQFTAEEEEAFLTEAQAEWDEAVQSYVDYFLSEDTQEARAQAWKDGEAYFQALGYSVAGLADSLRYNASLDRLWEEALKDKDLTVPEEEIRALFEEVAAMDQEQVGDSAMMYEMTKYMRGQDVWFVPEGYRGIIHILLDTDESLLNTYKDAQAAYEETVTEEAPEGDAALLAARDAALQAVLDSKKAEIDDIYARLEKGESFESLIAEYGTDPGMANENTLKEGYAVHRDSIYWDPVFTAAAFSDKMNQPGDTADPVVGSYGIHILHYLRDIPGGIVELSEEIHEEISDYLKSQKENQVIVEALEAWKDGHEIVLNQDLIEAAKVQAVADQAQADQE
ncbi:MAG: peptidylprolyl isomerase [Clostridiales bacterium]|nr:peptidylprolyl isomerase [Clostridiales bacterium]